MKNLIWRYARNIFGSSVVASLLTAWTWIVYVCFSTHPFLCLFFVLFTCGFISFSVEDDMKKDVLK